MAVGVGQRCVVRIKITGVELRNARAIMATIGSPQGEEKCQDVSFDEVSGLVYATVDVDSVGSWYMWLGVRFANEAVYTPAFVFVEVEGEAKPCDAPYIVDVEVEGESVSVVPPKIDVDAVTQEEFDALAKDVANKVDKVAGKGLSTNDYTNNEKGKVAEIDSIKEAIEQNAEALNAKANTNGTYPNMTVGTAQGVVGINQVQEALTLTTKSNGNIVIGNLAGQSKEFMPATPSGNPMHYAYEAVGAVWNANTGYWELNDLKDITNEEMSYIYSVGRLQLSSGFLTNSITKARTNIPRLGLDNANFSLFGFAWENSYIETINLTLYPQSISWEGFITSNYSSEAFANSPNLKSIYGKLVLTGDVTKMFQQCTSLQRIRLYQLNRDISFADSPNLSVESILYMIENETATSAITITLHQDAYMFAMAEDSIIQALENHPNVKLAQA